MLPKIDNSWVYKDTNTKKTTRVLLMDDIDSRMLEDESALIRQDYDEEQFIFTLDQYDLEELEKEMLLQRFYYNATYKVIAEEFNFVGGASSAHKAIRRALAKLSEQGFSL